MRNSDQLSDPIYYTLFCRCTAVLMRLTQLQHTVKKLLLPTTILMSQTGMFWLFFIHLYSVRSHPESTQGDTLTLTLGPGGFLYTKLSNPNYRAYICCAEWQTHHKLPRLTLNQWRVNTPFKDEWWHSRDSSQGWPSLTPLVSTKCPLKAESLWDNSSTELLLGLVNW